MLRLPPVYRSTGGRHPAAVRSPRVRGVDQAALIELLGAVPATGMAFIVVQHLDPNHESLFLGF